MGNQVFFSKLLFGFYSRLNEHNSPVGKDAFLRVLRGRSSNPTFLTFSAFFLFYLFFPIFNFLNYFQIIKIVFLTFYY